METSQRTKAKVPKHHRDDWEIECTCPKCQLGCDTYIDVLRVNQSQPPSLKSQQLDDMFCERVRMLLETFEASQAKQSFE